MVKWSCASALCFNNHTTLGIDGKPLKFYRLPRLESLKSQYRKILKTDGINWKNGYICCEHWSSNERLSVTDLPDVVVSERNFQKLEQKYENANNLVKKSATELHKKRLRNAKQKLETARNIMNQNINTPSSSKARRTLTKSSTYISSKKRNPSKLQYRKKLEKSKC